MSRSIVRAFGIPAVVVLGSVAVAASPAGANQPNGGNQKPNSYVQHNLVSDLAGKADQMDPDLVNPWGLAQGPATPAWVADNGTDVATLYRGDGVVGPLQKVPLTVTVPGGAPTGQVFNSTGGFVVHDDKGNSGPAAFIFDSESGDITGWNPAVPPATPPAVSTEAQNGVHVDGAIYKGLALATVGSDSFLYAANFHAGTVDVFDSTFTQVKLDGTFKDPHLPKHYAPFGIASIEGKLYVSYAVQDAAAEDEVDGFGRGIVDVFDNSGHFVRRLISFGHLDAPWGMTIAPDDFGKFSGDLLVGNFGNGRIHAYDAQTGRFKGTVKDAHQKPIVIDGLWGLMVGNGTSAATNAVIFSAGIDHENHGLYGTISAS